MNLWIWVIALFPAVMFALSNLIDKKIVHGETDGSNPWAITALSAMIDIVVIIPLTIYCLATGNWLGLDDFWPLFFNGIPFTLGGILFLYCIKRDDASSATAIFQIIPVLGIFMGMFGLHEKLNTQTIVAILFIVLGGYILSITKNGLNRRLIVLMLLSSVCYAGNDFIIAKFGREVYESSVGTGNGFISSLQKALPAIFADLLGKIFFGMIALVGRDERRQFALSLKCKLKLVVLSSIVYDLGDTSYDLAKIFAPLAVVQALLSTQPLFVLAGEILLVIVGVKLTVSHNENNSSAFTNLDQKIAGIIQIVIGGILLAI